MSEAFIGEIRLFGGTYAPMGWAMCNGQVLSIAQNDALFALIGTTYGGDGQTTFALPDLRGRIPLHQGNGEAVGQAGGTESVTLTIDQAPVHSHVPAAQAGPGVASSPDNGLWAASSLNQFTANAPNVTMNPAAVGGAGGGQPHANLMPFQVLTYIIALEGIFPSRN
jgi:microcystin-dependent protein